MMRRRQLAAKFQYYGEIFCEAGPAIELLRPAAFFVHADITLKILAGKTVLVEQQLSGK